MAWSPKGQRHGFEWLEANIYVFCGLIIPRRITDRGKLLLFSFIAVAIEVVK